MLLSIAHNPTTKEPKALYKELMQNIREEADYVQDEKLDKAGMEALKNKLSGSMGIQIKS